MKKVLILHGTNGKSGDNWFPWLKSQLEAAGREVWVPDLPRAEAPHIRRYNDFILAREDWDFDADTTIVGHSSGAVAALGLLAALPEGIRVAEVVLVGAFKDNLGRNDLDGLFERPLDYGLIKGRASKFTLYHSDDDPFCPLEQAKFLAHVLEGDLILMPGQKHFSVGTDPKYTVFPELSTHLLAG